VSQQRIKRRQRLPRGRRDHLLPQGYLAGFCDPNRGSLWVHDRQKHQWFATGTRRVAAIRGFYDYSEGSDADQSADDAFRALEDEFPRVVRDLASDDYRNWESRLEFLLRFGNMLRARSELFRREDVESSKTGRWFRVEEVVERGPQTGLRVAPCNPGDVFLRNKAITDMRAEIAKGAGVFSDLNWCLRVSRDCADPVVTSDNAIILDGTAPTRDEAQRHPDTLFFFPISAQACLIGSPSSFGVKYDSFIPSDLRRLHSIYRHSGGRFIYSPSRIQFER